MAISPWVVHAKGGPNEHFEICVVRKDDEFSQSSYGWMSESKIFISSSGGPCGYKVNQFTWDLLMKVASKVAARLNQKKQ